MKRTKKILSLVFALVLALAMAMPVMAASEYRITVTNENASVSIDGKVYSAYKLFEATYSKDGEHVAYTYNEETCLHVEYEGKSGEDLIKWLGKNKDDAGKIRAFADYVYTTYIKEKTVTAAGTGRASGETATIDVEAPGYYLVYGTGKGTQANEGTEDVVAAVSLTTAKPTANITPKLDAPQVEKKVYENQTENYGANDGYGAGYNDVADYNIGDPVPFSFYSKVPDMTGYKTYKYILHDVMDNGLTFNPESVTVTIGEKEIKSGFEVKTKENSDTAERTTDGCAFEIVFDNLKAVSGIEAGQAIRVNFKATLNGGAEVGLPGNTNTVHLEYSNNPYDEDDTTSTPEDKVVVFTYELDVTKIDGATANEGNPTKLAGAQFNLYRMNGDKKEYAQVTEGKISGWTENQTEAATLESDANGLFTVAGLDEGTYYLQETKAPDGYNLLEEPYEFTVKATTVNGQEWSGDAADALTGLSADVISPNMTTWEGNVEKGAIDGVITNNSGTELPSTGGMGTTIFYVIGGILVIGAAILLISKRRADSDK